MAKTFHRNRGRYSGASNKQLDQLRKDYANDRHNKQQARGVQVDDDLAAKIMRAVLDMVKE